MMNIFPRFFNQTGMSVMKALAPKNVLTWMDHLNVLA